MVAVDLSTALEGRVAGQTVDILRIANEDVWDVSAPPSLWTEHNVFGSAAAPVTLTPHSDLPVNGLTASNFLLPIDQTGEWELVGGRIYIPSNISAEIALPFQIKMGYSIRSHPITEEYESGAYAVTEGVGDNLSAPQTVSSVGWFEYRLPTPIPIYEAGGIAIGWRISDGRFYVHAPGSSIDAVIGSGADFMATDGSAVALSRDAAGYHRGEFGQYTAHGDLGTLNWAFAGAWYGADIILRKKN